MLESTPLIPRKDSPILPSLRLRIDVWILLAVLGLLLAGWLAVYSASYDIAFRSPLSNNDPFYYLRRQVMFGLLGLIAMFGFSRFDYHWFRRVSLIMGLGALLALVALFVLSRVGGNRFGLAQETFGSTIAFYQGSVQPAELVKFAMVIYLAHWLSAKGERVQVLRLGLLPFSAIVGFVAAILALLPDLGTAVLISLIGLTLFVLAGAAFRHIALIIGVAALAFWGALQISDYAKGRIDGWQEARADPVKADWQVRISLAMLAAGGLSGEGVGNGQLKYGLPVAHSDFVFSVWVEELGLWGSLFVVASFALLGWRGLLAARRARDAFGYYLAAGMTLWIVYQAVINIGVATAALPATGLPLPFMSYGGSSLVMTLAGVGVLLNVSRDAAIGRTLKESKSALESIRENLNQRRGDGRTHLPRTGRRRSAGPTGSDA